MENIKVKKAVGRPRIEITDEFIEVWKKWRAGEFKTTVSAMRESHTAKTTFYRLNKILEKKYNITNGGIKIE